MRKILVLLIVSVFTLTSTGMVFADDAVCPTGMSKLDCFAITGEQQDWVPNNGTSGACTDGGDVSSVVGADNAEKIWNYLSTQGLSADQAAGVLGNLQAEGGFDPAVKQNHTTIAIPDDGSSGIGFGIAQWTSAGRQAGVLAKIKEAGLSKYYGAGYGNTDVDANIPDNDLDNLMVIELNFLWQELTTNYKDSTYTPLTKATSYDQATRIWMLNFESPADQSESAQQGRISLSKIWYNKFKGGTVASGDGCGVGVLGGVSGAQDAIPYAKAFLQAVQKKYGNGVVTNLNYKSSDNPMSIAQIDKSSTPICRFADGGGAAAECGECTALTAWYVSTQTKYTFNGGDGGEVVGNLQQGIATGKTPQPFSVFSVSGTGWGSAGHTGVILGVLADGDVISLENNMPGSSLPYGTLIVRQGKPYAGATYAYVGNKSVASGSTTSE